MNRLSFILQAKTQYNIQSPFLFDLYSNVIIPKVGKNLLHGSGIKNTEKVDQMLFKLMDHYGAVYVKEKKMNVDYELVYNDGAHIGLMVKPHKSIDREKEWARLVKEQIVTLSVDLFDIGLVFTSPKLSKQHWLLR